jgi:O-antigen/teichoic acid export membrane protein
MRGPGEARLLASGALLQQLAQGSGLLALLVIVTLLARRVSVAEVAAYGLISSLAGYLLVLKNSVSNSSVRAMASAGTQEERARVFSAAAVLYAAVGLGTGLLIVLAAIILSAAVFDGELAREARSGGLGLAAITAVGITASVYLDALRAERRFLRAASAEIVSVGFFISVMVALILGGAALSVVIAVSGALPLITGTICAFLVRREDVRLRIRGAGATRTHTMSIVPTAGWLLVVEVSTVITYASGPSARRPLWASSRARCAPTTSSTRSPRRSRCRPCPRRRATPRRTTSAGCNSWQYAAPATRSRCSCRCA